MTQSEKSMAERMEDIANNEYHELTEWEVNFVSSIQKHIRYGRDLSDKQINVIERLEQKIRDKEQEGEL